MRALIRVVTTSVLLVGSFAPALAHPGHADVMGFWAGLAHPFGGIDHLLAMICLGVIAGAMGGRAVWALPAAFVGTMTLGALAGAAGLALPAQETWIAASLIVFGAVIASGARLLPFAGATLAAFFAAAHGFAHGAEMPAGDATSFIAGFVLSTIVLHGAGLSLARLLARTNRPVAHLALRAAGLAVVVAGAALTFTA